MKKLLCGLLAGLLAMGNGSVMAQTSTVVSGKTNNGDRLKLYSESVRLENKYWRRFNYDLIQPDGTTLSRTATTPWCRNGKIELDSRASSESSSDYQKGASWFAIEAGTIVYADSTASRNLLKKVCEAVPQLAMQSSQQSISAPSLSKINISDVQASNSDIQNYKIIQAYTKSMNEALARSKNPVGLSDEKNIEYGLQLCKHLNVLTIKQTRQAFIEAALKRKVSEQEEQYVLDYYAKLEFYSIYWFCPQHKLQLAEESK